MGWFSSLAGLAGGLLGGESARKSASKSRRANAKIMAQLDQMLAALGIESEADFKKMFALAGENRENVAAGFKRAEGAQLNATAASQRNLLNRDAQLQAKLGADLRRTGNFGSSVRNSLARGINSDTNRGLESIMSGQANSRASLIAQGTGAQSSALKTLLALMGQQQQFKSNLAGQRVDVASGAFRSVPPPSPASAYAGVGKSFASLFDDLDLSSYFNGGSATPATPATPQGAGGFTGGIQNLASQAPFPSGGGFSGGLGNLFNNQQ